MSFQADIKEEAHPFLILQEVDNLCFECGEEIENAVVRYDGYLGYKDIKSISFHPSCAALVGQRLITDGYPNRGK